MVGQTIPACLKSINHFEEKTQRLGTLGDPGMLNIAGVRVLSTGTVFGKEPPQFVGEIVICEEDHPTDHSKKNHVVYLGFNLSETGWIKLGEEVSTNPSVNHVWGMNEKWSDSNRWVHYANNIEFDDKWSHCDTWGDSMYWDDGF